MCRLVYGPHAISWFTNSMGKAAAKIYAPSVGYWRILAAPTAKSWDARSAVTRR